MNPWRVDLVVRGDEASIGVPKLHPHDIVGRRPDRLVREVLKEFPVLHNKGTS